MPFSTKVSALYLQTNNTQWRIFSSQLVAFHLTDNFYICGMVPNNLKKRKKIKVLKNHKQSSLFFDKTCNCSGKEINYYGRIFIVFVYPTLYYTPYHSNTLISRGNIRSHSRMRKRDISPRRHHISSNINVTIQNLKRRKKY